MGLIDKLMSWLGFKKGSSVLDGLPEMTGDPKCRKCGATDYACAKFANDPGVHWTKQGIVECSKCTPSVRGPE